MSGIFGICRFDGAPVDRAGLNAVAEVLKRRGPDRTGIWSGEQVGLGQTLLATTPEALEERLPLIHRDTGCTITADVRLDNRAELIAALGLPTAGSTMGDGELILNTYLAWGPECADRLLGDFAFAIWDPRDRRLICARDKVGMRQLIYHHAPGRMFGFATEADALLKFPAVPMRINEGRIADYLVNILEAIDLTSTFFEDIYRLPPAHLLIVDRDGMRTRRYGRLDVGPELTLSSDAEYAEAFLDVFSQAVQSRLRSPNPVGSMLSGGMDSSSVVAVASRILAAQGQGPLRTFSAAGPDPELCPETRHIRSVFTLEGLVPTVIDHTSLGDLLPELTALQNQVDEPFDDYMNLPRAIYLAAHRQSIKVMLDGVAGDVVLSHGDYITRLLKRGSWYRAVKEAVGEERFWGSDYPAWRTLLSGAFEALAPEHVYQKVKSARRSKALAALVQQSAIDAEFASRVDLRHRLSRLYANSTSRRESAAARKRAVIEGPTLVVARERYDRASASLAIEARDPFLDARVVEFSLRLPNSQLARDGWPKYVLRRAVQGQLPDSVCWRVDKTHLGPEFTAAVATYRAARSYDPGFTDLPEIRPFVRILKNSNEMPCSVRQKEMQEAAQSSMATLARWLARHTNGVPPT